MVDFLLSNAKANFIRPAGVSVSKEKLIEQRNEAAASTEVEFDQMLTNAESHFS
jgi:hypothetical protein